MQRACPIINALTKVENRWQTKQQWGKLMYQRIYIDIVFMTNFLMDYMLLRLVGKFLHLDGKRRRCVISAAFGSFVSCLLVCAPFKIIFPAAVLIHGGCAFFMASFAFRLKKADPYWRRSHDRKGGGPRGGSGKGSSCRLLIVVVTS